MDGQLNLPFPTMDWGPVKYKVTGVVTNRDVAGDELIWWYRARCGKSEEAHAIMKEGCRWKAPVSIVWSRCRMVAGDDSCIQPEFVHEASGLGGGLGESPHESGPFLVDQSAWSRA
jgi:hypothetical protein